MEKTCYNKNMSGKKSRGGFTLVELSLSVVFISVLSVAVALILSNAISAYHRGVIMNQVNTTGMDLVDDMRAAIQDSYARSVTAACSEAFDKDDLIKKCEDDSAQRFVMVMRMETVKRKGGEDVGKVPIQGAFCTGSYSYIWNSGYLFNTTDFTVGDGSVAKASLQYKDNNGDVQNIPSAGRPDFRLLKLMDEDRAICKSVTPTNDYPTGSGGAHNLITSGEFNINKPQYDNVAQEPVDILSNGESNLALYDLSARSSAESKVVDNVFYSVSFILATVQGGINIKASGDFCVPPGDMLNAGVEGFNYCAINKFNFAAQANGGD